MIYNIKPLAFDPKRIKGLSEKLLVSHYENHYGGAVKRLNAITAHLAELDFAKAPVFMINGLKREELIVRNSIILHEIYFDGIGGGAPSGALADAIAGDFGSLERWRTEFSSMGKAEGGGSGWVVLAYSPRDKRLTNQWVADHTTNLAGGRPVLVLDMYEHAYHIDYGAKAASYVDAYMEVIRWENAAKLYERALVDGHAIARDAIKARVDTRIAKLRTTMPLKEVAVIKFPDAAESAFDHGAFDPQTRRVIVAHTRRDRVEVIDHDQGRHIDTLNGFPEAAGVVAEAGQVLVTNRGRAELAWVDARTLKTLGVFQTGVRPNGVAMVVRSRLAVVACIGDSQHMPKLQAIDLAGGRRSEIELPGPPRWCVTDSGGERIFLAIREPSMLLVARLPELTQVRHWTLPVTGAHGLDIDHEAGLLYAACDEGALVAIHADSGEVCGTWSLDGGPDATFFNPASGLVHVAIGKPGLIHTIDPRTGEATRTATALGAKTTALAPPDGLYVFSPVHRGALVLAERGT
jgi:superoxide dismutase